MRFYKVLITFILTFTLVVAGCSNLNQQVSEEPPKAFVKINDQTIEAVRGGFYWEVPDGLFSKRATIADSASPAQIAQRLQATLIGPSSEANIEFSDQSKPQVKLYVWEEERGMELPVSKNKVTLPSQHGIYVFEIFAQWPNGEASYTFVIEVQ